ncbi:unnamed protein product [Orchesella dallaii]|uniref:Uncharacterized protein n=1 Tax=Orchesella dallaii TaxID=48710 RepID=A0ABP1RX74_9HEXA
MGRKVEPLSSHLFYSLAGFYSWAEMFALKVLKLSIVVLFFYDVNIVSSQDDHTESDYDYDPDDGCDCNDNDYVHNVTSTLLNVALPLVGFIIMMSLLCCFIKACRRECAERNAPPLLQTDLGFQQSQPIVPQVYAVPFQPGIIANANLQSHHILCPHDAPPEYVEEPPPTYSSIYFFDESNTK